MADKEEPRLSSTGDSTGIDVIGRSDSSAGRPTQTEDNVPVPVVKSIGGPGKRGFADIASKVKHEKESASAVEYDGEGVGSSTGRRNPTDSDNAAGPSRLGSRSEVRQGKFGLADIASKMIPRKQSQQQFDFLEPVGADNQGLKSNLYKHQQSTVSTRSLTMRAKEAMKKETKRFFGLDDCEGQAQLWEERRRRHACRSNGPIKDQVPCGPSRIAELSRQVSQTQRAAPSFRVAAQSVLDTPSAEVGATSPSRTLRSNKLPALVSIYEGVKGQEVPPPPPPPVLQALGSSDRNKLGLQVELDSAEAGVIGKQTTSSSYPESLEFSEISAEEDDVFDSQVIHGQTPRAPPKTPNSRRDSLAKITWDGLAFAATKVVRRPGQSSSAASSVPLQQMRSTSIPQIRTISRSVKEYEAVTLDPQENWFTRMKKWMCAKCFDGRYHQDEPGIIDAVIGEKAFDTGDNLSDYRPYFTWWVTTVQVVIMILALISYDRAPFGFSLQSKSGMVLMASLSIQNVKYWEASNFWLGPRAADLIRLGAKYTPCMRNDQKIQEKIDAMRRNETNTGCCIRNDNSGCVQSQLEQCSTRLSVWEKWKRPSPGPDGRLSGAVCGQDPRYCKVPSSIAPHIWLDDITKWPQCQEVQEDMAKAASHMTCEIIGRPCCIGIHGECRIVSQEYCSFVRGTFHEEATLCSQVSCLNELCGMSPFYNPDRPDQIYRLWLSLFIHAGIIHAVVTVCLQFFFMRDLEKMAGPIRIGLVYMVSGIAGNLASAIFEPHKPEVGPGGAHFGLLASLFVELRNNWAYLISPKKSLLRLLLVTGFLFLLGFLPWVDCWAHGFGFVCGFLLSYALFPFAYMHKYESEMMWKLIRIIGCLVSVVVMLIVLFILFYVTPVQDCKFCDILNCIPFTKDLCAEQKINYNKELDIL